VIGSLVLAASPASAHLVETGFGAYYDGVVHLVATPSDLLVVVALALLAGQHGTRSARWGLFALPASWLIGGAIGAWFPANVALPLLTTLSFALTGALVAFDAKLKASGIALIAAAAGLVHGYANGTSLQANPALMIAGGTTTVFCMFALFAAQLTTVKVGWGRIALRAAGSWIAAAGLLMLGWLARG
jgi:hydrogenase/urease accessory protein HupE